MKKHIQIRLKLPEYLSARAQMDTGKGVWGLLRAGLSNILYAMLASRIVRRAIHD